MSSFKMDAINEATEEWRKVLDALMRIPEDYVETIDPEELVEVLEQANLTVLAFAKMMLGCVKIFKNTIDLIQISKEAP